MVVTPSDMIALGSPLVDFTLFDVVDDVSIRLQEYREDFPILLAFICNHCPYVQSILDQLVTISMGAEFKGVKVLFISSNDVDAYPQDSPAEMKKLAAMYNWKFPYLYDETQQVAREYSAQRTPDFFLYDAAGSLVYRGRFDSSTPGNDEPVTGADLSQAIDAVAKRQPITVRQHPSYGCNIKWK